MSTTPFDEQEAAAEIGFPGESFDSIAPYFVDGLYWVVIGQGDKKIGRPVIVENGHVVRGRGYAVGMAWLRKFAALDKANTAIVPQVLRWYDSLPIGWSESDAANPKTGGVTLHPTIEVKLVSATYIRPQSRSAPPASGPPNPPPGWQGSPSITSPAAPAPTPSGSRPSATPGGLPPTGPVGGTTSSGSPSGGYAPSRESRATLLEVDGKLTWVIESMDPKTKQWHEDFREAAEK
jgi:hypothetical protein